MSTTIDTAATTSDPGDRLHGPSVADSTVGRKGARVSRKRHRVLAVLSATLLAAGIGVATGGQPAAAASSVTGCFRNASGMVLGSQAAHLDVWTTSGWVQVSTSTTSWRDGCVSFAAPNLQYWYAQIRMNSRSANGDRITGTTPYYSLPGTGQAHLGTGYPSCFGFCYGF